MTLLDPQRKPLALAAAIVLVIGIGGIGGAWAFQIIADMVPCPLCLQQRWPYYLGLPLAAISLGFLFSSASTAVPRVLLGITALLFLGGAALGAYHSGVEWHWWPGPSDCAAGAGAPESAAGLLRQMERTRVVRCDEAAWRFLGLSFAGYNVLLSLAIVGLIGWALKAGKKA